MKTKIMGIITVVLVLGFAGMASAGIVELNLFDLGCPTEFDFDSPYWRTDFDIGVTFAEITNVYINWSGEIEAELVGPCGPTGSCPLDALFVAWLYESNPQDYFGHTSIQTGEATWPQAEVFDIQSAFTNEGWSMLLDGNSSIEIHLAGIYRPLYLHTIAYPSGRLNSASLLFEGTVVPEPTVLLFLVIGIVGIRLNKCKD